MRHRNNFERKEGFRSSRLVIIATEGHTERIYFNELKIHYQKSSVQVEVLEREGNNSCPDDVLSQVQKYEKKYNLDDDDEIWVVIDRDKWTIKMIKSVAQCCYQNKHYHLGLSNPCFELWLLLHLEDIDTSNPELTRKMLLNKRQRKKGDPWLKVHLRELMGSYNETSYDVKSLMKYVDIAINRAQKMDNPADRWPRDLGTRVYLVNP